MLILLGIDSEFGTLEGFVAPFYDAKWVTMKKWKFTGKFSQFASFIEQGFYEFIWKLLDFVIHNTLTWYLLCIKIRMKRDGVCLHLLSCLPKYIQ